MSKIKTKKIILFVFVFILFCCHALAWRVEKDGLKREVNPFFRSNNFLVSSPPLKQSSQVVSEYVSQVQRGTTNISHYNPPKSQAKERAQEALKKQQLFVERLARYQRWYSISKWKIAAASNTNKDLGGYYGRERR